MIPNLPGILQAATKTLKTNFPPDQLSAMLELARKTDEASIQRYVLGSAVHHPSDQRHERLHPGPGHGADRQAVDQHLRGGQPLLHRAELNWPQLQRPSPASIAGIVRATILRSSHSDQWSM